MWSIRSVTQAFQRRTNQPEELMAEFGNGRRMRRSSKAKISLATLYDTLVLFHYTLLEKSDATQVRSTFPGAGRFISSEESQGII
jgi:hypothetical protein